MSSSIFHAPITEVIQRISNWGTLPDSSVPLPRDTLPLEGGRADSAGFQLLEWPQLRSELRTARVLRALSVMSHRPVTVNWLARQCEWSLGDATRFVEKLCRRGQARQVTPAGLAGHPSTLGTTT